MRRKHRDRSVARPPHEALRGFGIISTIALCVCVMLKLPSVRYPRSEADERIYWQLAENLVEGRGYTLQGTELLSSLSSSIYDRPLFHHPPLFPALLTPFVAADAPAASVVVSWCGHLLAVVAVAIVGRHMIGRAGGRITATSVGFWLPILGVAADPLLSFVSRRLWIDSIFAGLIAIAAALLITGAGRRRSLVGAGVLLGLAALAKLTALTLVPLFIFAAWRPDATTKDRALSVLAVLTPVVLLVVPWLVVFYLQTGVFVPPWVKPDAELMMRYPFMRAAVERPWYYYMVKLLLVAPLVLIPLAVLLRERAVWNDRALQIAALWFAMVVGVLTVMGTQGYGFQMRHIAAAPAALYMIVTVILLERERPLLEVVCGFAILVGAATGAMSLLVPELAELNSLFRTAGLSAF